MYSQRIRTVCVRLLFVLILTVVCVAPMAAQEPAPSDGTVSLGNSQWVQVLATHEESPLRIAAQDLPTGPQLQAQSFVIDFAGEGYLNVAGDLCHAWPPQARAAANYAAVIWSSLIHSPVTIHVQACWTDMHSDDMPPNVLGHSGAHDFWANESKLPANDTWYPVALASALVQRDLNGVDPEIVLALNRGVSWYLGTDAQPPRGKYDMVSVMLHEIAHGIGFYGSMEVRNGRGYWGCESAGVPRPFAYDLFTQNAHGQWLISFPNGSEELASYLTSGKVYFDGPFAVTAAGEPVRLYAPYPWRPGSSYSHLDATHYQGGAHSLMTPTLSDGAAFHYPGAITLGILADIGWARMIPSLFVDLRVEMNGQTPSDPRPGDTVTYNIVVSNSGPNAAQQVQVTNILPPNMMPLSWNATRPITQRPGSSYVWDVQNLAPGQTCTITVQAAVKSPLPLHWVAFVSVSAVPRDQQELSPADNKDVLIFGYGLPLYLPAVLR